MEMIQMTPEAHRAFLEYSKLSEELDMGMFEESDHNKALRLAHEKLVELLKKCPVVNVPLEEI